MPKGKTQPEIYWLFLFGAKPIELIKLGYNKHVVYSYSRKYNLVKETYDTKLAQLITLRNEKKDSDKKYKYE